MFVNICLNCFGELQLPVTNGLMHHTIQTILILSDPLCSTFSNILFFCRLAAHLCQSRCQEALDGNKDFIKELLGLGFSRVQINALSGIQYAFM